MFQLVSSLFQIDDTGLVLDWNTVSILRGENVEMIDMMVECPGLLNDEKYSLVGFDYKVGVATIVLKYKNYTYLK